MRKSIVLPVFLALLFLLPTIRTLAGPYDEAGIPAADPRVIGWATGYRDYLPADDVDPGWQVPERALGPATGNVNDVVTLGERDVASPAAPGEITLTFDIAIQNRPGIDLAVFENGIVSVGGIMAEFGYVEVSTDGQTWARFPSVSLIPEPVGGYGTIDATQVYNLAGKHVAGEGTPFDLDDLSSEDAVLDGLVDLDDIQYVKIVDVPGGGNYFDEAASLGYDVDHPIYDAYPTYGSGGFDLEAIAVFDENAAPADDDVADDDVADDDFVDDDLTDDDISDDDDAAPDDDDATWWSDDDETDDDNDAGDDFSDDSVADDGCA